ncbi:RNA polymerase II elongation factor ELL isoform X2 [Nerophis ophidion]|nr:RNA polymerase II elongation factor ELL isoform X2 [Nerophis ophidion]
MAALKEERCYALSCGRVSNGNNVSVFHVKLTDSSLRAFEGYRGGKVLSSQPLITFSGNQGKISIPRSENSNELHTFTFYLSHVGRDNPQGSFDCIQQYVTSDGSIQLDCLGAIQDKITVCATDDSYQKARESMAQVEEETRSRGAIVIKPGGRFVGKKVQIRKPVSALSDVAPSRRTSRPVIISSSAVKKASPKHRPLRERLVHLLALKPYKKPELLLRLQKDGLLQSDKDSLDGHLQQVANLNGKDNTLTLKDFLYKEILKDWPGYTEGDQQLLKRILLRKQCQAQNNTAPPPESPPKELASSSPSQKRPAADFIDPLNSKKPRISHLASKAASAPINGKLSSSNGKAETGGTQLAPLPDAALTSSSQPLPLLDIPRPFEALSDVSNDSSHNGRDCDGQEMASERLGQPPSATTALAGVGPKPKPTPRNKSTSATSDKKSKKKSKKHKDKDKMKNKAKGQEETKSAEDRMLELDRSCDTSPENLKINSIPLKNTNLNGICNDSTSIPLSSPEVTDYLLKYTVISSQEQRQKYKN